MESELAAAVLMLSEQAEALHQQFSASSGSKETALLKTCRFYETIIECMPGNVYWYDVDCQIQGVNKNVLAMLGVTSFVELRGMNFEAVGKMANWDPVATASFHADTLEVLNTRLPKLNVEEPPIYHANGQVMYFLTSRMPVFDDAAKLIGVVGISIDISQRKVMEQALREKEVAEEANRTKQAFLSNIRHDIRTPFTGLLGMSRLLEEMEQDSDKKEKLQWIAEGAQSLLDYLNELVEYIEVESGARPILYKTFDLEGLLQDTLALFLAAAKAKNLTLHCQAYDDLAPRFVIGDKYRVQRVLINLLSNAIKFTRSGYVEFGVKCLSHEPNLFALWVKDSGIGIPSEKYSFIVEKFGRLNNAYDGIYKGTGLGLPTVKKIMDELGGRIEIASVLGQGSTFTCVFPLVLEN